MGFIFKNCALFTGKSFAVHNNELLIYHLLVIKYKEPNKGSFFSLVNLSVTGHNKARFRRRSFHEPNLIL